MKWAVLSHGAPVMLFLPALSHIPNLFYHSLFRRIAGVIKPDFSQLIALSAVLLPTISRVLWPHMSPRSHECRQLFWTMSPRRRQFFGRKVEVMSEPLRAG